MIIGTSIGVLGGLIGMAVAIAASPIFGSIFSLFFIVIFGWVFGGMYLRGRKRKQDGEPEEARAHENPQQARTVTDVHEIKNDQGRFNESNC